MLTHLDQADRRQYDPKFLEIYVEDSRFETFEVKRRNNAVAGLNVYLSIRSALPTKQFSLHGSLHDIK